ncbi:MAG: DUF368 domain-containing protein [Oscillospiraceae bacterium]|nr:DUF368 domain-containing protein [Oscillospiraceae bacterium]
MSVKKFLMNPLGFIYGAVFGLTLIIPGLSGSTMLVVMGCYDRVCEALALDIKSIKKNLAFLAFFFLGTAVGILGFSSVVSFLHERYPVPTYLFFAIVITCSLPFILSKMRSGKKLKPRHFLFAVIALTIVVVLGFLEGATETAQTATAQVNLTYAAWLFFCGFVAAAAMMIPGLSGAFLFMLLGVYYTVVEAASITNGLDFFILVPAALGILLGIILGAKGIKYLLNRFYTATYSAITGFVIGSVVVIVKNVIDIY